MKTISLPLLGMLFFAQGVFAQNEIVLYGLRTRTIDLADPDFANVGPLTPADFFLGVDLQSINPATGEESFLFTIDGARLRNGNSTYNADQDRYLFLGPDTSDVQRIYSADLGNSEVASSPAVTADIIFDIEYNYANGKVYGLRKTPAEFTDLIDLIGSIPGIELDLVEIDLETGTVVVVSEVPDTQFPSEGSSTFDPINNRFIFKTRNIEGTFVVGIDVTNGETAFSVNLGSVDDQVMAFEYDWTNQRLLGIRQTSTLDLDALTNGDFSVSIENFLVEIDVETGEVRDISATPAFDDFGVVTNGVAFDQQSGTYITYVQDRTLGMISSETGQVFNTVELSENLQEIQVDNLAFARSLNLRVALLGDINQDGNVGFHDVSSFVSLLIAGDFQIEADCNQDGVVNLFDVAPFVGILTAN